MNKGYIEFNNSDYNSFIDRIVDKFRDDVDAIYPSEFSGNEVEIIRQYFDVKPVSFYENHNKRTTGKYFLRYEGEEISVEIISIRDEWYYASAWYGRYEKHYKCDQFDGLISCLEFIKNNFT